MLETARLIIRPFTLDDLETLIELRSDEEVMKYLGGAQMKSRELCERRLQFYVECDEKLGYGMSLMYLKSSGELVGWSGLQPLEDTGETEVGYALKKTFWRQGLGFECAKAWLTYGFNNLGLKRIVAITVPQNLGSRRIMEKLGMTYEKTEEFRGMECVVYAISRNQFEL